MQRASRWDIFCTVVDNYGDIGICWRLARQLAREHGILPTLWVDDLASFARIEPRIDRERPAQECAGVRVRHWSLPFAAPVPGAIGAVVVEAFACHLPPELVAAMAARRPPPLWINLEYLSAEAWVAGCHGLPSPQASGLAKHFFFPGFVAGTGGLARERDLEARRRAFLADGEARARFWSGIGLPLPQADEIRVSLFGYPNPALDDLLAAWAASPVPVRCIVPEGPLAAQAAAAGSRGALDAHVVPMLPQDDYDRLLWACDCNFVRGEDSFVRAQWAAHPFVWQIYRQQAGAHWPKLDAFLDRYCSGLAAAPAQALRALWLAWNRGDAPGSAWPAFLQAGAELARHAEDWRARQASRPDLAAALVEFCALRLE
jgi:uncharacterized repeat protein (TIGR03837 family)